VHNLFAHVNGRPIAFERDLDGLHGAVNARAVAAGLGEQDTSGHLL
jgi:hypothetical protein